MKKALLLVGVLVLASATYLTLWPVPIKAVRWSVPAAPGYTGAHAANDRLAGLQIIDLGGEEGPEHIALGPDGKLYATVVSGNILRMNPDGIGAGGLRQHRRARARLRLRCARAT